MSPSRSCQKERVARLHRRTLMSFMKSLKSLRIAGNRLSSATDVIFPQKNQAAGLRYLPGERRRGRGRQPKEDAASSYSRFAGSIIHETISVSNSQAL